MPIDTPEAMRSRVPPSTADSERPAIFAWRSQAVISSSALAMLWVRTRFIAGNTSRGCSNSRPTTSGARNWVTMCQTVSVVSPL